MLIWMDIASILAVRFMRRLGNTGSVTLPKYHHVGLVGFWDRFYSGAPFWTAIGTFALAGVTFSLVQQTKEQGKRNHEANERSYRLTLHQINLQYKADVYRGVIRSMAQTRIWFTVRLDSLMEHLAEPTNPLLAPPRQLSDEEMEILVALELHASTEALSANSNWYDKVQRCSDAFDALIHRDVNRNFNQPSNPHEGSRIQLLEEIRSQISDLEVLEKVFLDLAKTEVRLEP